jgi:hypothetical protein
MAWRQRWIGLLVIVGWLAIGCGIATARAAETLPSTEPSVAAEASRAFQWFDTLGFPDVHGKQLVEVKLGLEVDRSLASPQPVSFVALLVGSDGDQFSVLTPNLSELSYRKTPSGTPANRQVSYQKLDLKAVAEEQLAKLRAPKPSGPLALWQRFSEHMSEQVEAFILARICNANGLPDLGFDLYAAAVAGLVPSRQGPTPSFDAVLSDDIADALMWQYILDFGDPTITRLQLFERFHRFAQHFPKNQYAGRAAETADLLQRMIREDKEHGPTTRSKPDLPVRDRVTELIFQLRDQNGQQWSQPGRCDIFDDPRGDSSPAAQLAVIGLDAVPQLIDALTDVRFTRSVGFHRNFYFSHHVLRVGDCALAIIERIAGRSFYERRTTNSEMQKDNETAATKKGIERWWADVQKKGERQVLIEGTIAGDWNSYLQAQRLVAKYPDAALDAIINGIHAASEPYVQSSLISVMSGIKDDSPLSFLRDELKNGPTLEVRQAAAEELFNRSIPEAVPAMVAEWRKLVADQGGVRGGNVIQFLASVNRVDAIEARGEGISKHPVSVRFEIVEALMGPRERRTIPRDPKSPLAKADQPTLDATEAVLIGMLDDQEEQQGTTGTWYGYALTDPRICDMAAVALAVRMPDRYAFKTGESIRSRDRQCLAMQNTWRAEKGLPPLAASPARNFPKPSEIDVDVQPADIQMPSELADAIAALRQHALTSDGLMSVITAFARAPEKITELDLVADREEGTGFYVQFRFTVGQHHPDGSDWSINERVARGSEILHHSFGGAGIGPEMNPAQFSEFKQAIDDTLKGPPNQSVEIRLYLKTRGK